MYRLCGSAKVLPTTITGSESHDPVLADIPFFRTVPKMRKPQYKSVWNFNRLRLSTQHRSMYRGMRNKILSDSIDIAG